MTPDTALNPNCHTQSQSHLPPLILTPLNHTTTTSTKNPHPNNDYHPKPLQYAQGTILPKYLKKVMRKYYTTEQSYKHDEMILIVQNIVTITLYCYLHNVLVNSCWVKGNCTRNTHSYPHWAFPMSSFPLVLTAFYYYRVRHIYDNRPLGPSI